MVHDETRIRTGRMGPLRTTYYRHECLEVSATKLKDFLRSMRPTTVIEFPDLGCAIDITRTARDRLYLAKLPPPIDTQEIGLVEAPWGPGGRLTRTFLICPYCEQRRASLFIPWGSSGLGCRVCKSVTYPRRRDRLAHLVVEHNRIGVELERLWNRRLASTTHLSPPTTDDEINARAEDLLSDLEAVGQQLRAYGGHVGAGGT